MLGCTHIMLLAGHHIDASGSDNVSSQIRINTGFTGKRFSLSARYILPN